MGPGQNFSGVQGGKPPGGSEDPAVYRTKKGQKLTLMVDFVLNFANWKKILEDYHQFL